ncbi:hypothetical protein D9615_008186 [Tricholomella constricta]|uniref:Uncharacterized protein n=1 Tax=Tricholomella constricta TaxID=117010 RepID=A0A8H5H3U6_9AGAR|nr:hypothetical protein D9615_008186 [Tricholomella constricta]
MANWIDFFSLVLTLIIAGGVIYGILFISKQITQRMESTKEKYAFSPPSAVCIPLIISVPPPARLKNRGLTVSNKGVSIKTSKRFDREDYMDATQRGVVKAFGASTFGSHGNESGPSKVQRQVSSPSLKSSSSGEEKKKRSLFRRANTSKERI